MSAPITEAHREIAQSIAEAQRGYTERPDEAAQLIADSEARACDQLRAELADEKNLHAQTRTVVEELNTICTDLRNAGGPPFIRSEAIRLLREDQCVLRAEVERFTAHGLLDCHAICDQRDAAIAERDQLIADCENETKWAAHYLADAQNAKARADRAEAEVKQLKADGAASAFVDMSCRASRAEAELAAERARLDWLEDHGWVTGEPCGRAAIDAAMKEGK